jgi:transposase
MSVKRKQHSAEFKARVALETLKGKKTLNELATEFGIHPNLVTTWKNSFKNKRQVFFKSLAAERVNKKRPRNYSRSSINKSVSKKLNLTGFHWTLIRSGGHHQYGRQGTLLRQYLD